MSADPLDFADNPVPQTPPLRAMMDPEDRELLRGMTIPEMKHWPLKLVKREPVEATKDARSTTELINEGHELEMRKRAFAKLDKLQVTMTPEGRAEFDKDAEAEGYVFSRLRGPCCSFEEYTNPSRSPFIPPGVHAATSGLAGGIHNLQDPNGLPQHAPGAKNDAGKQAASLLLDFSRALSAVAEVSSYDAVKYSRGGWQHVPDGITRYRDAEWRHLLKSRVEECDSESGLPHSFHRLWNCLAVLELELREAELRQQKQDLESIFK